MSRVKAFDCRLAYPNSTPRHGPSVSGHLLERPGLLDIIDEYVNQVLVSLSVMVPDAARKCIQLEWRVHFSCSLAEVEIATAESDLRTLEGEVPKGLVEVPWKRSLHLHRKSSPHPVLAVLA